MCYFLNTAVGSFFGSVKLNEVEIFAPPASQGANATCSVDWIGSSNSPNREVSDTSVSVSTPAHVKCNPPAQSLAAFWHIASDDPIMTVTAPVGSIIDVHLSLILQDDDVPVAAIAVATGALGTVYYLSLDPNATHRYTPVSLTTTT